MGAAVRYLLGWVVVELACPCPERWFNLCGANGLAFWNVERRGPLLRLALPRHRLAQARALAERCQSTLTVLDYGGLGAFLGRFRRRWGMLAGAAAFLLLVTVLGRVVMVIDIEGNVSVPDAAIVALLQRCGFGVGSWGPGVDVRELSNRALLEMEELSFLTVDVHGIRAHVEVREAAPVPEIIDDSVPADLIAARDGFIVRVDRLAGEALVQRGDSVLAGEVLVSHLIQNRSRDGTDTVISTQTVRASGAVWAVTEHTLSARLPRRALLPGEGTRTGWALRLLGRRLNFYRNSSQQDRVCGKIVSLSPLTLPDGTALPFGLRRCIWRSRAGEGVCDAEQGTAFLKSTLRNRLCAALGEGRLLREDWTAEVTQDSVTVTLRAACLEQIARTKDYATKEMNPFDGETDSTGAE